MSGGGWKHDKRSRHERGYGATWDRLRLQILERDTYLCRCPECALRGRIRLASQVDHITPKAQGGGDSPSNLRAVSRQCHARITLEQQGKRPARRIGIDGFPVSADDEP